MDALMTPHGITCISSLLNCHKRRSLAVTGVWLQSPVIRLQSPVVCRQRWPPRWCNGMSWILCPLPLTPGRACKLSQRRICRCQARPGSWKCVRKTSNLQHTHTHTHTEYMLTERWLWLTNQGACGDLENDHSMHTYTYTHTHTILRRISCFFYIWTNSWRPHTPPDTRSWGWWSDWMPGIISGDSTYVCVCGVCVPSLPSVLHLIPCHHQ